MRGHHAIPDSDYGVLAQVLRAFACWKPDLGYHPIFARLAAHIMAVLGNEKQTFQILVDLFQRYQLGDYFERYTGLDCDATAVWSLAQSQWPDLAYSFSRFPEGELMFKELAKWLLSTLLTEAHRAEVQPFEYHVRLLHHLLFPAGNYDPADPRAQLRHIVLKVIARHQYAFLKCSSVEELEQQVRGLRQHVHVDEVLLTLLMQSDAVFVAPCWPTVLGASCFGCLAHNLATSLLHVAAGHPFDITLSLAGAMYGGVDCLLRSLQWSVECTADEHRALLMSAQHGGLEETSDEEDEALQHGDDDDDDHQDAANASIFQWFGPARLSAQSQKAF